MDVPVGLTLDLPADPALTGLGLTIQGALVRTPALPPELTNPADLVVGW